MMKVQWTLIALLVAACGSNEPSPPITIMTDAGADMSTTDASPDGSTSPDMVEGETWPEIADIAQPVVDWEYAPALSIALVRPNSAQFATFGESGTSDVLDEKTQFEIGSVTKVFTALLLADAAVRAEAEVDGLVATMLPTEAAAGVPEMTLTHLATHTSGLPRLPGNFMPTDAENPYADYTEQMLWDAVAAAQPTSPSAYAYSNFGSAVLGQALARNQNTTYAELLSERVLTPLGLTDTTFTPQGPHVQGHAPDGVPTATWDLGVFAPAGDLHSNAADMVTFVQAQLGSTNDLSEAIALSHEEHARWPGGKMGLGWHFGVSGQPGVMWHNGATGGFSSFVGIDLDAQVGVVVLASQQAAVTDLLGVTLLARLKGNDYDLPLESLAEVPTETLDRYVGEYQFAPTFSIVVTRDEDRLYGQATGQPAFRLWPSDDHTFHLRVVDATITFIEEDGNVTAMELDQGGVQRGERVN